MITLAMDTSTARGSVALLADGMLLLDERFSADRSHTATLFTVLERARSLAERIDQIAVGLGPGSYAGVRIAIAAALGLELATGARLVGIPSVASLDVAEARDRQAGSPALPATGGVIPSAYVVIGDARRETFYFTHVDGGVCVEGPLLATATELAGRLAAASELPLFATEEVPGFPQAEIALPSAAILARNAAENRGIVAVENLEPIYLREPHITRPKSKTGIPPRP